MILFSNYFLILVKKVFLEKAVQIADRMLPAFETATGIPLSHFNPTRYKDKIFFQCWDYDHRQTFGH